ncbi:MAG: hypothetical protein KKD05_05715 [Candidatus Omnitrophica bacterium]|nr:hypothetical protein [Candidatus Omnitrophota bacterium]
MDKDLKVGQGIPFDPIEPDIDPAPLPQSNESQNDKPDSGKLKPEKKKNGSPIILIFLVIFVVFSVSAAGFLYMEKEKEVVSRLDTEARLEKLILEKSEIEQNLKDTLVKKSQLEIDLEQGKENYSILMTQYQEEQSKNEKIMAKFNGKMELIASLKSKLAKEEKDNSRISEKLNKVNSEFDDVKTQLGQIRMAKEALENRIIQLKRKKEMVDSVELETIVVDQNSNMSVQATGAQSESLLYKPLPQPAKLEGQVLVVNKEFAFVVVNIGEKDGIKNSEILTVFRGTEILGKVQVERIYDTMSSAVILPEQTFKDIQEGDIVKLI